MGAPAYAERGRCALFRPVGRVRGQPSAGQPENDSAVTLFPPYRFGLSSDFSARFGYVGPGTVAVPGATGPLCRGAANGPQYGGGAICANAGPATVIITAAMPKTLIMTVSMPRGLGSRQRGNWRWSS